MYEWISVYKIYPAQSLFMFSSLMNLMAQMVQSGDWKLRIWKYSRAKNSIFTSIPHEFTCNFQDFLSHAMFEAEWLVAIAFLSMCKDVLRQVASSHQSTPHGCLYSDTKPSSIYQDKFIKRSIPNAIILRLSGLPRNHSSCNGALNRLLKNVMANNLNFSP